MNLCSSPLAARHHSQLVTTRSSSPLAARHHSQLVTTRSSSPLAARHHSQLVTTRSSSPLAARHHSQLVTTRSSYSRRLTRVSRALSVENKSKQYRRKRLKKKLKRIYYKKIKLFLNTSEECRKILKDKEYYIFALINIF